MRNGTDPVLPWIGLSGIPRVGRVTFRKLIHQFGSPERVLSASLNELKQVGWLSDKVISEIRSHPWRSYAEEEITKAEQAGVSIITADSPAYPGNLLTTPDPPLFLYVKGTLLPEDAKAVAIVGTRRPTHYGTSVTERIAFDLASRAFTIVSGMARGIDTRAHKGALAAKGRTIAVLGCGIDIAYPPENKGLLEEISSGGAVITENPFGTRPEAGYFPGRNRIISGLALGTVIIEATQDSGSLITAKFAREQGRKLYAVPGHAGSPTSKGTNSLIKEGAALVENAVDILKGLGISTKEGSEQVRTLPLPPLTPDEEAVLRFITNEPKHIDVIMGECGAPAGKLSALLISLELKGLAMQLPGKYYTRQG